MLEKVRVENAPDEQFVYNTYNPILLGVVLERATAMSVAEWTAEGLWKRMGMEFEASWSLDGGDEPLEKMESGFNARALWWIHAAGESWPHAVGAWGHLGQYIYVFPDQDLVIVRFGRKEGGVWWPEVFRAIADTLRSRDALA